MKSNIPTPLVFRRPMGKNFQTKALWRYLQSRFGDMWFSGNPIDLGGPCFLVYGWIRKGEVTTSIHFSPAKICFLIDQKPHYDHEKNIHQTVNRMRDKYGDVLAFYGKTKIL